MTFSQLWAFDKVDATSFAIEGKGFNVDFPSISRSSGTVFVGSDRVLVPQYRFSTRRASYKNSSARIIVLHRANARLIIPPCLSKISCNLVTLAGSKNFFSSVNNYSSFIFIYFLYSVCILHICFVPRGSLICFE